MIKLNAFAKVNLFLKIKNKRSDGYHEIESIMQEIDLHDEISIDTNSSQTIELFGESNEFDDIPWNEKNLSYKAAKFFLDVLDKRIGLNIRIKKNIPTSAGLGGGSSDAAATLIGVNRLCKANLPEERLIELAEKIGSDVPFFICGKTALVTGKGEKVIPIAKLSKVWFVLVKPPEAISTKWAYENFDLCSNMSDSPDIKEIADAIQKQNKFEIFNLLHNDFEKVIYEHYPKIKAIKDALINLGAQNALLSGSGSTVFGVFDNKELADNVYNKIIFYDFGKVFLCSTL